MQRGFISKFTSGRVKNSGSGSLTAQTQETPMQFGHLSFGAAARQMGGYRSAELDHLVANKNKFSECLQPFGSDFHKKPLSEKKVAIENVVNCLNNIFQIQIEWGTSNGVPQYEKPKIAYDKSGYARNVSGVKILINENWMDTIGRDEMLGTLMHEYKHSLQFASNEFTDPNVSMIRDTTPLIHDTLPSELDAQKFALSVLKAFGFDEKKTGRYQEWLLAFDYVEYRPIIAKDIADPDMNTRMCRNYEAVCTKMGLISALITKPEFNGSIQEYQEILIKDYRKFEELLGLSTGINRDDASKVLNSLRTYMKESCISIDL